jgi:hypothetical protein
VQPCVRPTDAGASTPEIAVEFASVTLIIDPGQFDGRVNEDPARHRGIALQGDAKTHELAGRGYGRA